MKFAPNTIPVAAAAMTLGLALTACGSSIVDLDAVDSPPPSSSHAPTTLPPLPSLPASPARPSRPVATFEVEVDDGTFDSVAEMARASRTVIVGGIVDVTSLGQPGRAVDAAADEFLAITVRASTTLSGDQVDEVVIAWDAFVTDTDGERTATRITNGLRPPDVGDQVLLFLQPVDRGFAEYVGGTPTHQLVKLDGLAYIVGGRVEVTERNSHAAEQLMGMTLATIAAEVAA